VIVAAKVPRTDAGSNNYHGREVFGYGAPQSTGSTIDALPAIGGPRSEVWERDAPGGERPGIGVLMAGNSVTSVTDVAAIGKPSRRQRTEGQPFDSLLRRVLAQSP
jgi:hypothetical protein